jgi:PAS domain S-box-containing protein
MMNIFRNISIRNKVTIISMLTCMIVLIVILLIFITIELTISRRALVEKAATLAEVIGINSTAALAFNDKKSAGETVAALSAESEIEIAAIYTRDGKLFAQYRRDKSGSKALPSKSEPPEDLPGKGFSPSLEYGRFKHFFHGNYLEIVKSIVLDREIIGSVYLEWSLAQLYRRLKWYIGFAFLALLPSLFVAYLLSSRFQQIVSRPIMGLAQTMKIVSQEKNYAVHVEKESEDELGALIDGFNEMLAQIQKRDLALEQHREVLEQAVTQRTAELSQSNRELEKTVDKLHRTADFLAQNERRLAYAQKVARLGYWEWYIDADKLIWSGEVCRLFGMDSEEIGMEREAFISLLHPEDQEAVRKAMDDSLGKGKAFGLDFCIITANGVQRILNLQGEVIIAPIGKPFKMTGTIQDITERKEAERALIESEEKYRALINNASEGILLADVQGNLLEANKKMLELLDYSLDELLNMNFLQLIPSEETMRANAVFTDLLASGAGAVDDTALLRKDGKRIPIDITASLVRYAGKTVVQAILRDTSERKKMEEERLLLSKIESLGLLAGGIAHDFNNILTAILGNISLARLEAQPGRLIEDNFLERLEQAERACQRAQALAGQLLSFAKGGLPIKKVTSVSKLIKESINLALSGSKARSELSLPEDLRPIEVDESQISQVLNNLLINADQAMPEGGVITVLAENVTLSDELPLPKGDYVKITVSDQGIGIPHNYLGKIFDPYFTTKQKGSGLGLATSYSIIRNHGGNITVESKIGAGTSFHVYLPAIQATNLTKEKPTVEPIGGRGRILVMDDDEMVRDMLIVMLRKLGYEARCAEDGEEAIKLYKEALAESRPFAAVIFDLTVPGGMGGKEAIRQLRAIDPQIKAIVSSGYSDDPIMANFQIYGFQGVITKPYRITELSKILSSVTTINLI